MTRSPMARRTFGVQVAGLALALAGCGGNGGGSSRASLRVLNLTDDLASLDLTLNGNKQFTAAAQGSVSAYQVIDVTTYTVGITNTGSVTSLFTGSFTLGADKHYTAVVWGPADSLKVITLPEDETAAITTGTTNLRVYNGTTGAGAFDVYLTPVGTVANDLSTVAATRAAVGSGALSGFAPLATGDYRLRITAAGNPQDVRLDVPSVTLANQQYATLIITAGAGDALVDATVLAQQGTVTGFNNGTARIRLAASVQLNGNNTRSVVSVKLAGTAMANGTQSSPNVGPYTTVASGNVSVEVLINGVSALTTTQSVATGKDYTLMVWGTQAAPQVVLLADTNALAPTGRAYVRLVNGDDTAGPVTLLVDNGNVFVPDVQPGSGSGYFLTTASTSASVEVQSQTLTPGTLFSNTDVTLLSGGVYTLFLLRGGLVNGVAAPTVVLRKDR